jgi:hypothetical protein
MIPDYFDAPLCVREGQKIVVDVSQTPFFYNDDGRPTYVTTPPQGVTRLVPAASDPKVAIGREYVVSSATRNDPTRYGVITQLGFIADEVIYEPMWATRDVAAAFGITLVEKGQAVQLSSPVTALSQVDYQYGVFAGHWSPYQGTESRLLTVVCTDLEHHDSPHVFASIDPHLPLVISVGRYWPKLCKIRLADLWVPRDSALYIPPKPIVLGQECLDLHNNRNSARACWGSLEHDSVKTKTMLQLDGFFHWFWNARPTVHTNLTSNTAHTLLSPQV